MFLEFLLKHVSLILKVSCVAWTKGKGLKSDPNSNWLTGCVSNHISNPFLGSKGSGYGFYRGIVKDSNAAKYRKNKQPETSELVCSKASGED